MSLDAVQGALAWGEFLESHARRLYASLGQAHIQAARSVLKRLRRGELSPTFTLREVYRRGWAHLTDAEAARAGVDVLESKGWIRSQATEPGQGGGRPSIVYQAHPSMLR